jgi:hypothetical protein
LQIKNGVNGFVYPKRRRKMRYFQFVGVLFLGVVVGCSGADSAAGQGQDASFGEDTSVPEDTNLRDVSDVAQHDDREGETTHNDAAADSVDKFGEYKIEVGTQTVELVDEGFKQADTVEIDSLSTGSEPIWVTVRNVRESSGELGKVIGHSALIERNTKRSDFRVSLKEGWEIKPRERYRVVLHTDKPADGEFKFKKIEGGFSSGGPESNEESAEDKKQDPPLRVDDELISASFEVKTQREGLEGYALNVQSQPRRNPEKVKVKSVKTGKKPAWIAISRGDSDGPTELIGHSKLIPSDSQKTNLSLSLDGSIKNIGRPMYASVHIDKPADEAFERGEPLIFKDGQPLIKRFEIEQKANDDYLVMTDVVVPSYNRKAISILAVETRQQEVWAAVHEVNRSNQPGKVIGFSNLIASDTLKYDVKIPLFRPVESGEKLEVIVHQDNPSDGLFTYNDNRSEDQPIMNQGDPVGKKFQVRVNDEYALRVSNKLGSGDDETFDQIAIDEVRTGKTDAWVVVSESKKGLESNAVLGSTFVERRSKQRLLPVSLNRELVAGEKLYVHFYEDNPNDETLVLTGDDADQPIRKEGGRMIETFKIKEPASN